MPVFTYTGVDAASKKISGVIEAESEKAARAKLRKQRVFPTKLVQEGARKGLKEFRLFHGVGVKDVATMTRQLATLIGANIPLIEALAATLEQVEHPEIRKALADIKERVSEGARLGDCMMSYPKVFDTIYIYMVKAGEASGALDVVLKRLADYKEAQALLRRKIASAMNYPIIMFVVSTIIIFGIFTYVVPKITRILAKQKVALPWATKLVMFITDVLTNPVYLIVFAVIVTLLFLAISRYKKSPRGREKWDNLRLKTPVFGELNRKVAVARFSRTLSTLLASGVQLLPALEIVRNIMDNVVLSRVVEDTMVSVKEGESLADPLRRSGRFPPMFIHMIMVGERTGLLEQMLEKVADTYAQEVDAFVSDLTAQLTPFIIVFIGGVIGFIVMAVLMPIFQLMQR